MSCRWRRRGWRSRHNLRSFCPLSLLSMLDYLWHATLDIADELAHPCLSLAKQLCACLSICPHRHRDAHLDSMVASIPRVLGCIAQPDMCSWPFMVMHSIIHNTAPAFRLSNFLY